MYFLTDDERKIFLRKMLPNARKLEVEDELRGWNWHQPALEPVYEQRLAVYEVSNAYCPTNRDLFLRRVQKIKLKPNFFMISGRCFHQILVSVLEEAKKQIYMLGTSQPDQLLAALCKPMPITWPDELSWLTEDEIQDIKAKGSHLRNYEQSRITARIGEILTQQPYIGADSLANLAIPVVCEHKIDGRFLGLSQYLSADALIFSETMIMDLKFGAPQPFHRLATTGYALAMEAKYEMPVNLGCIVYGEFKNGRLVVTKDMHLIDDELRQWFIENRDKKMQMIFEEIDPGIANDCMTYCPGYTVCHG